MISENYCCCVYFASKVLYITFLLNTQQILGVCYRGSLSFRKRQACTAADVHVSASPAAAARGFFVHNKESCMQERVHAGEVS